MAVVRKGEQLFTSGHGVREQLLAAVANKKASKRAAAGDSESTGPPGVTEMQKKHAGLHLTASLYPALH